MFENELMTPDNSQARDDVRGFLIAYLDWANNDAPPCYFKPNTGLCGNLTKYLINTYDLHFSRTRAAGDLLTAFLRRDFGGERLYPFGKAQYGADQKTKTHHRRPERIAWAVKILAELSPCEQQ